MFSSTVFPPRPWSRVWSRSDRRAECIQPGPTQVRSRTCTCLANAPRANRARGSAANCSRNRCRWAHRSATSASTPDQPPTTPGSAALSATSRCSSAAQRPGQQQIPVVVHERIHPLRAPVLGRDDPAGDLGVHRAQAGDLPGPLIAPEQRAQPDPDLHTLPDPDPFTAPPVPDPTGPRGGRAAGRAESGGRGPPDSPGVGGGIPPGVAWGVRGRGIVGGVLGGLVVAGLVVAGLVVAGLVVAGLVCPAGVGLEACISD